MVLAGVPATNRSSSTFFMTQEQLAMTQPAPIVTSLRIVLLAPTQVPFPMWIEYEIPFPARLSCAPIS